MRRHNSKLTSFLFAWFCSMLMTTMLISVRYYGTPDLRTNSGFRNIHGVIPNQETLIEKALFGNGGIGYSNKLISLAQSESCRKECDLSIPVSMSGKMSIWANRNLLNTTKKAKYTSFQQTISPNEYDRIIELFTVFRRAFEQHNLTYFLYGGTLLGAYRHFGLVPWDDDVDVMVNGSERQRIELVLGRVPGYSIDKPHGRQWKFFRNNTGNLPNSTSSGSNTFSPFNKDKEKEPNERVSSAEFIAQHTQDPFQTDTATNPMWPYIDIFFFDENSTHIWDDNPSYTSTYCFSKDDVFPLRYMPFENRLSPVPSHTGVVLATSYNVDLCVTSTYSHKHEHPVRSHQVSLPCRRLYKYFPFVFRYCDENHSLEKLVINEKPIYAMLLKC